MVLSNIQGNTEMLRIFKKNFIFVDPGVEEEEELFCMFAGMDA